ncbi:MAG: hypothetical protein NZM00_03150, partial [Anaerolinea sp.]|nr:hypothetical protein [Anaerolinea sp.]
AARVLGVAHPLHVTSLLADNPCALPCLWGITPGHSTRADVLTVLPDSTGQPVADVGDGLLYFTIDVGERGSAQGVILIDLNDRTTVQTVRLSPLEQGRPIATLADALLYGPPPRSVYRTCNGITPARLLIIFGDNAELMVEALLPERLSPGLPLTLFDISVRNIRSAYDARASFGCSVETGWLGFAPRWRYFSADPAHP